MSSIVSNAVDLRNPKEIYVSFVDFVLQECHLSFENLEGCRNTKSQGLCKAI